MNGKRLWVMDVDGVLSPYGRGSGAFTDWFDAKHPEHWLPLSLTQGGLIAEVLERTGTELVWATSWGEEVHEWVAVNLGWPTTFRVLATPEDVKGDSVDESGRWWKLARVAELVAAERPDRVVWSDDDHKQFDRQVVPWAVSCGTPVLLQSPRKHAGLSRRPIREAGEFLTGVDVDG